MRRWTSRALNRQLVLAIADLAVFLEFSEETAVDPDSAMRALEGLAATLQGMTSTEQATLAEALREAGGRYSDPKIAEFVAGLPAALGLQS